MSRILAQCVRVVNPLSRLGELKSAIQARAAKRSSRCPPSRLAKFSRFLRSALIVQGATCASTPMARCVVVPGRAGRVDEELWPSERAWLERSADLDSAETSQLTVWAGSAACPNLIGCVVHRLVTGSISSQADKISVATHCGACPRRVFGTPRDPVLRSGPSSIVAEPDETVLIQIATHASFIPGVRHCLGSHDARRAMRAPRYYEGGGGVSVRGCGFSYEYICKRK